MTTISEKETQKLRECALPECDNAFVLDERSPHKKYCSNRHRARAAARASARRRRGGEPPLCSPEKEEKDICRGGILEASRKSISKAGMDMLFPQKKKKDDALRFVKALLALGEPEIAVEYEEGSLTVELVIQLEE